MHSYDPSDQIIFPRTGNLNLHDGPGISPTLVDDHHAVHLRGLEWCPASQEELGFRVVSLDEYFYPVPSELVKSFFREALLEGHEPALPLQGDTVFSPVMPAGAFRAGLR